MTFLESAVEALAAEVRVLPSGAKSLAHVTAVVPTAQAGRRLRIALARRFGALVPPDVRLPDRLLVDADDPALATRADELLAFREARGNTDATFDIPAQLSDLRRILAEKAVSFADVAAKLSSGEGALSGEWLDDEAARWRELAETERRYLAALERRGRKDRIAVMKAAKPPAGKILDFTVRKPVSPESRPPAGPLVIPCGTCESEAERIAALFAAVAPDEALPALCVADPEVFTVLASAFEARGLHLHDPSRTRLVTSSLGHLVRQLSELKRTGSYQVFSAFVRGGDARRWLKRELGLDDGDLVRIFVDLDNRQSELLPEKIDDIAPRTEKKLRAVFEFVKAQLRKKGVREILEAVFRDRPLDEREAGDREFAAAAECVGGLLEEIETLRREGVSERETDELFARLLDEAEYSLEPDEGEVILSDGWLDLPFVDAGELVIAGFREGRVPESTVGHPFLPDSLRRVLGLTDNSAREIRDREILRLAVADRPAGAVTVLFHSVDARGDVLKPSRLLFETDDDEELCRRVKAFYGTKAGTGERSVADLPAAWKLKLPVPPAFEELKKISPTRLDGYLKCPFTYYLRRKDVLGDKRMDDRAEELASWEYGNLAHEALEAFGLSGLKDSADAGLIRDFLLERVDAQLTERFGTAVPAIVAMQGESVKRRLANFAVIQAARREAGWTIVAVERKLEIQYDHTRMYGKCDRIDFNAAAGEWCVIDYKTWDSAAHAVSYDAKKDEWLSIQLPVYCAMLDADSSPEFAAAKLERISSCYCVLGKTADDVVFTQPMTGAFVPLAEARIRELVPLIEKGIFWPPSPKREWQWDYADWLAPSPEESVDEAWIADQLGRCGGDE